MVLGAFIFFGGTSSGSTKNQRQEVATEGDFPTDSTHGSTSLAAQGRGVRQADESVAIVKKSGPITVTVDQKTREDRASAASARYRVMVRRRYVALYRMLNLTRSEIESFEEAVARDYFRLDVFNVKLGSHSAEEEARLVQRSITALEDTVKNTLGEHRVGAVREFIATSDLREVVDRLAANLAYSKEPLPVTKGEKLLNIIVQNRTEVGTIRSNPVNVNWSKVLEDSSAVLDSGQLALLRALVDRAEYDNTFKDIAGNAERTPIRGF